MADITEAPLAVPRKKKRMLLPLALTVLLGGAGFASSFLGYWSPLSLMSSADTKEHAATGPVIEFVDIPRIHVQLSVMPARTLLLSAVIETEQSHSSEVRHLLPRVSDVFNTFLSGIDAAAFDKRGVLEIVRDELVTRTRFVVGEEIIRDVLIMEFRLQ